jgi:predicted DsbA family dithiol-disulfide isomerase
MQRMTVEIWSDIVCPWCYIGKRRFESALARFAHRDEVDVRWRSFQLDPHAPHDPGESVTAMLAKRKGIALDQAQAMNDHVSAIAEQEGLTYRLESARFANTFDAHRLIHLADAHGLQAQAKERLLRAYFTDGLAIAETDVLVAIGAELGLDAEEVRTALEGDAYAVAVRADLARARSFGIQGVPFFVLDERYAVSGAQSPDIILGALERAWAERAPLAIVGAEGAEDAGAGEAGAGNCDENGCEI